MIYGAHTDFLDQLDLVGCNCVHKLVREAEHKVVCLALLAAVLELCIQHYLGMRQHADQRVGSGVVAVDSLIVQIHMTQVDYLGMD